MRAFTLAQPKAPAPPVPDSSYIAGGTDLMQLMRNHVTNPAHVVDLTNLVVADIAPGAGELRLGAGATMADVAAHPEVRRRWPVLSEALLLSASQQIRNMATIGGNLLQRTRCNYFRDTGFAACNKRNPGSGCAAIAGNDHRDFAIFGTSDHCIAQHASDMAVAMIALDASLQLRDSAGATRTLKLAAFYHLPGDSPHLENALRPGEVITHVTLPASPAAEKSRYLKIRDRSSFAFALVSAAVALDIRDGAIHDARVALGGVGTIPWRAPSIEAALRGRKPGPDTWRTAAGHLEPPAGDSFNTAGFKMGLARRVVAQALQTVAI